MTEWIDLARIVLMVVLDTLGIWACGYVIATEDVFGGTRTRFENWTYGPKVDKVRYKDGVMIDEFGFDPAVDWFWDRTTGWEPFRRPLPGHNRLESKELKWGFGDRGRKVPIRMDSPSVLYAVPMVDEGGVTHRLSRANRAATVARGKLADLWGCPRCSGWWGGLVVAVLVDRFADLDLSVMAVVVLHVAAWGVARRVDWSHGD